MNRLHDLLAARLSVVRQDLEEALTLVEGLPITYAPATGMRTLGGQLQEILATEMQLQETIAGGATTPFSQLETSMEREDLEAYRAALQDLRAATVDSLNAFDEDALNEEIEVGSGWDGLGMGRVPRAEVFRSLAAHEWYHTGQIVSYAWSAGRNPYSV